MISKSHHSQRHPSESWDLEQQCTNALDPSLRWDDVVERLCYSTFMAKRPNHVKAPDYLSESPPVPKPEPMVRGKEPNPDRLDPTRYGDWELKGVAVDF